MIEFWIMIHDERVDNYTYIVLLRNSPCGESPDCSKTQHECMNELSLHDSFKRSLE
jgi:hypothetical protein